VMVSWLTCVSRSPPPSYAHYLGTSKSSRLICALQLFTPSISLMLRMRDTHRTYDHLEKSVPTFMTGRG